VARADSSPHILDEVSLDVYRAEDSLDLAAGLDIGNVRSSGLYWSFGGRVSWLDLLDPGPEDTGWGVGAVAGLGLRPTRYASPVFRVGLDRTFGIDRFDWRTLVSAGVRVRVVPKLAEHFAITFSVFRTDLIGSGSFPDESDHGLGVFYSAAVFERR
jgi:hypothetical protein